MSFGNQVVTFVTLTGTGECDDFGVEQVEEVEVSVDGCRHRPLSAAEASGAFGNLARQVWKTTAPPEAAAIAAKSTGTLKEGGKSFAIIGGAQAFQDMSDPFKVTIFSEIYPE
jgi:hypothetical protein